VHWGRVFKIQNRSASLRIHDRFWILKDTAPWSGKEGRIARSRSGPEEWSEEQLDAELMRLPSWALVYRRSWY